MSIYFNAKIHDSINVPNIYYDGNVTVENDGGYTFTNNGYRIYISPNTLVNFLTPYISFNGTGYSTENSYILLKFKHSIIIDTLEGELGENYTEEIIELNRSIGTDINPEYQSTIKITALSGNVSDIFKLKVYPFEITEDLFIYSIEIYNYNIEDENYEIYLSTREGVIIDGNTTYPYMISPSQITNSIQPSESKASTSSINLEFYNKSYELSQLIYKRINNDEVMFWNEKVEIWQNLNGEEKRIFNGSIRDITNDKFEGTYNINCADIFDRMKIKLFAREFAIYNYLGIIEDSTDINEYRLPFYIGDNSERKGFYYREDYGEDNSKLVIEFFGTAMDFIEMTLQMIFSNPILEIGVPWLSDDWKEYIDIESFEEMKEILTGATYNNFYFAFVEPIDDPFELIREQILKPCRIYPFINDEGQLGLKLHQQPTADEGLESFSENNIVQIISKKNSIDDFVNHMMIKYNKQWFEDVEASTGLQQDEYATVLYSMSSDSVQKTRALIPKRDPLTFEVEGINLLDESSQNLFAQNIIDSYFSRYSNSITEISFQTTIYFTSNINVGDYIGIKHKTLVEWQGDNEGKAGIGQVDSLIGFDTDNIARLNIGDKWGGFVYNNRIGISIDGTLILDTTVDEIQYQLFNGETYSCQTNHNSVDEWLSLQGV